MTELSENYKGVFDGSVGFGAKPALIVIDFIKAYTTEGSPLYAEDVKEAVNNTVPLVKLAKHAEIPVIFTKVLYNKNLVDGGIFVKKVKALQNMIPGEPLSEIVNELEVTSNDTILEKQYASCFFGTSLSSSLRALSVDTLILSGCSTSGCVRATAVDGMQHGFRVIVPKECVGDRHKAPHEANLFDIQAKYGDVVSVSEVMERIEIHKRKGS